MRAHRARAPAPTNLARVVRVGLGDEVKELRVRRLLAHGLERRAQLEGVDGAGAIAIELLEGLAARLDLLVRQGLCHRTRVAV